MNDQRQMQELEEERMMKTIAVLLLARLRRLTDSEVTFLASELGLSNEYRQHTSEKEMQHAANW